ncbi:MAG: hypothetical protein AAF614_26680 [Chloroflexota bacterium]
MVFFSRLTLILVLVFSQTAAVASAAPCYQIFLPFIFHGGETAPAEKDPNQSSVNPCPETEAPDPDMIDFNGDGFEDVAIGNPRDGVVKSGSVQVMYGTASGLSAQNSQLWTQNDLGGDSQNGDFFGAAVTTGDFNGDGFTDLVAGSPHEAINGKDEVGQVDVIYGSEDGLTAVNAQTFSQATPGVLGAPDENDQFGEQLTSGDFDGDGYTDLAIAVPYESLEDQGIEETGAVNILYGGPNGLTTINDLILYLGLNGVDGTPADNQYFGAALVAADFNGDDKEDLAVGVPGFDIVGASGAGMVQVFFGSEDGISLLGEQRWRQGFNGIQGNPEENDHFGARLAAGDFDQNGLQDLVVGLPSESVAFGGEDVTGAGAVQIIFSYAASNGLSSSGNMLWHQGKDGVLGVPETIDGFGHALTVADFNGDGADDLAVSTPRQSNEATRQGMVQVFYSNGSTLSTSGQNFWMQGLVQGIPEFEDMFGFALGSADFNGDGFADLAAGSPYESVFAQGANQEDAGAVNIIYGSASGLTAVNNQIWSQDSAGIAGLANDNELFGFAITK